MNVSESPVTLAPSDERVADCSRFRVKDQEDILAPDEADAGWLWHGLLRPGNVTLLTSQWKSGKTTLVSVLFTKLNGAAEFLGLPIRAGRALIVTEEPEGHWRERAQRLDFGRRVRFICRPFDGQPRPDDWRAFVDFLVETRQREPFDLLVIDPLASFLPGHSENLASAVLAALMPLQALTKHGVSVLVLHHPRKGEPAPGQAARGSGALAGYVDVIIEMNWHGPPFGDDRRRRLSAWSRHAHTPSRLLIELNDEGTDYTAHGDFADPKLAPDWEVLFGIFEDASHKLTRQEILKSWPPDFSPPKETTLWVWLDRAVKDQRVLCAGTGRRNDPFTYWLPGQEELWQAEPRLFELEPLPDPVSEERERLKRARRQRLEQGEAGS